MPFQRPTLQQIIDRIVGDFNSRVENASTFLRRSVFMILARVVGGAHHLLYGFLDFMKRQLFILTADAEFLEKHGNEYGIARNVGVKAAGGGSGTGTTGLTVPADTKLQSVSGNVYTVDTAVTIAGGAFTVALTAEDYGQEYNESAGVSLTFVSPISGIDTTVLIGSDGLINGTDEETDDAYRNRLLSRKRQPPHGGADFDYVAWALEVSGTTRAWTIAQYQGAGTFGLAFVRDDDDSIVPTETQRLAMEAYIISHTDPETGRTVGVPVTAEPGFFMIPLVALTVNFTIAISPNTAVVQASVRSRLEDLFKTEGGPSQTITISQMYEAIVSALGENKSKITAPADDVGASVNQVHVLGDITFGDYT